MYSGALAISFAEGCNWSSILRALNRTERSAQSAKRIALTVLSLAQFKASMSILVGIVVSDGLKKIFALHE